MKKWIFIYLMIILLASGADARSYLSKSEILKIGFGSISLAAGGLISANNYNHDPLIHGPILFDRSLQKSLGGDYTANTSHWLDSKLGEVSTPLVGSILLYGADTYHPQDDKSKTRLQDQFLFFTGLAATGGFTLLIKGIVGRERPYLVLKPEEAAKRDNIDERFDHQSYFSGHTSSAFFTAHFLNKRLRSIMRTEMSNTDYRNWRWLPSVVLYGWSGYVGWSRIHTYKHYATDVITGAGVGIVIAELFLSFDKKMSDNISFRGSNKKILVSYTF